MAQAFLKDKTNACSLPFTWTAEQWSVSVQTPLEKVQLQQAVASKPPVWQSGASAPSGGLVSFETAARGHTHTLCSRVQEEDADQGGVCECVRKSE